MSGPCPLNAEPLTVGKPVTSGRQTFISSSVPHDPLGPVHANVEAGDASWPVSEREEDVRPSIGRRMFRASVRTGLPQRAQKEFLRSIFIPKPIQRK